ncbi:MAG: hypothetical protein JNK78_07550 [Planctomycetes bacterium]|nr:hypothetical protein [Planctomycetota bacterium]
MPFRRSRHALFCLSALAACGATSRLPTDLATLAAESPVDSPARLRLVGDRIAAATIAVGPGAMPPEVRTTLDAIAPGGELLFQGREWGPRGRGFRIEKRYRGNGEEHVRSVLIGEDGSVLERAHSVPLTQVPPNVLGAALRTGPHVDEARIVSGPEREEYWSCTIRTRIGRTFVVDVDLDGRVLRTTRRIDAHLDL